MAEALNKQTDVLSPSNFEQAQSASKSARKKLDNQDDAKDILHSVAVSRAYLNIAVDKSNLARANVEEIVNARRESITAGAQSLFAKEFKDADDDLRDLTEEIEDNDLSDIASSRKELQATYLDLELKAIQQTHLGLAKERIDLSKKEGASEFAPRSLAIAEKSYKDAEAYTIGNRHNLTQVRQRSAIASTQAEHVLKITREAKATKKVSPEDTALTMESVRGQVTDTEGELADKQAELSAEQQSGKSLSSENSQLVSNAAFQKIFEEARAEFNEDEAEVYKKGDTLVIRLKSLNFSKSQAVLKESDFALLAKVQRVIKKFESCSIIVEGHTDSVGSKIINDKISKQRATAVKEYLVSNEAIDQDKITSVGFGYEKPMATNKTVAGRSQNRRVDVLILPKQL